jgi:hypothetical protein
VEIEPEIRTAAGVVSTTKDRHTKQPVSSRAGRGPPPPCRVSIFGGRISVGVSTVWLIGQNRGLDVQNVAVEAKRYRPIFNRILQRQALMSWVRRSAPRPRGSRIIQRLTFAGGGGQPPVVAAIASPAILADSNVSPWRKSPGTCRQEVLKTRRTDLHADRQHPWRGPDPATLRPAAHRCRRLSTCSTTSLRWRPWCSTAISGALTNSESAIRQRASTSSSSGQNCWKSERM